MQLIGASPWRIVLRHIMPLCVSSVIVRVTLDMAGIILTAAGLGFLGLGAQPPMPEWGAMIANGRLYVLDQWWVAAAPGAAIFVVSLAFNLLGDGLRDALDPKAREMSATSPVRDPMLVVDDLRVSFPNRDGGRTEAVRGVSFTLGRERLGIVGESGSGKSQTGRAILGLTAPEGRVTREAARVQRHRSPALPAAAAARAARRAHRDGAAGPEVLAQSGDDDRRPDRRDAARALAGGGARGAGARARRARGGADRRSGSACTGSIRTRCRAAWASGR